MPAVGTMDLLPIQTSPAAHGAPEQVSVSSVQHAVKLAMTFFLEQKHYRKLLRTLAEEWKGYHSLKAAIKLIEAHGVTITPEEEEELLKENDEDRMIERLVEKMPVSKEQFEHFFLQLSFVASTTTRLRNSLEEGQSEAIEEALESAENVGVLSYLLRMAVSQAGQEVTTRENLHNAWLADTEARMAPLLTTSAAAMAVQKDLAQAKAQIEGYQAESREKARVVLLSMADGNDKALITSVFGSWADYWRKAKRENEIRAEYQDQIDAVNKKLMDYKEAQMTCVRGVFNAQFRAAGEQMLLQCIEAFKAEVLESKQNKEAEVQAKELAQKIQGFTASTKENAKRVMSRMSAGNESGLKTLAIQAWKEFIEDQKKDKELHAALKETEKRVQEYMKKQKKGATSVLSHMTNQSSTALVQSTFLGWRDFIKEEKRTAAMEEAIGAKSAQLAEFATKNKASAMHHTERVSYLQDQQLLIFCLSYWKRETKIERIRRLGKEKNEKRKKELVGVKGLFKNFANELETSLQSGTPRVEVGKPTRKLRD